jgi:hypothetical protein
MVEDKEWDTVDNYHLIPSAIASAEGLEDKDRETVNTLFQLYQEKLTRNLLRDRYYEMKEKPYDLGISVPPHLRDLEQVVGWCAKAVDSLANRSQFDGFVCEDDKLLNDLQLISRRNNLNRKYRKAVRSELKHACSFITVTSSAKGEPRINVYPATASSALWSDYLERISAGMVVVDRDNTVSGRNKPIWIDVFTDEAIIEIKYIGGRWIAKYNPHSMGRCLMEVLVHNATLERPLGTSRITRAVMNICDSAMRASVRSEISAEFFTSPQKYLLGADKEALGNQSKWDAYIGNIFAVAKDKTGSIPQFGQLSQGTMQPHVEYMRSLAARFSGETNVPINELGIVQDNPSSAEAIYAGKEPLVIDAQNLNADNSEALTRIAQMALAVKHETTFEAIEEQTTTLQTKFKNPAFPSPISQSQRVQVGCQCFDWYSKTDVALEEFGFDDGQIQRMRPVRQKAEAQAIATARFNELTKANDNGNAVASQSV